MGLPLVKLFWRIFQKFVANSSKALNKEKKKRAGEDEVDGGMTASERYVMSAADTPLAASREDVHLTENRDN